jgi:hypothetical protein
MFDNIAPKTQCYTTFYTLDLATSIRQIWKELQGANVLGYYQHFYITAVKCYMTLPPGPML